MSCCHKCQTGVVIVLILTRFGIPKSGHTLWTQAMNFFYNAVILFNEISCKLQIWWKFYYTKVSVQKKSPTIIKEEGHNLGKLGDPQRSLYYNRVWRLLNALFSKLETLGFKEKRQERRLNKRGLKGVNPSFDYTSSRQKALYFLPLKLNKGLFRQARKWRTFISDLANGLISTSKRTKRFVTSSVHSAREETLTK